jgi:diguanylate cyclase (GGDEF)-like protein
MTPGRSFQLLLDWLIRSGTILVAAASAVTLCGWLLNNPSLASLLPGVALMRVSTAVGLIAAAVTVWMLHTRAVSPLCRAVARALGATLVLLGALAMAQDLLGLNFGMDRVMLREFPLAVLIAHPGSMALASSFSFVFIGLALLTLKAARASVASWAHWLIVPPLLVATLAMMGYAYDVSALYQVKAHTSMAVHTAASFFVLSLAVLAADTHYGFASISVSDTAGGVVSRRLLPTLPVMIFLLDWVAVQGQRHGLYDSHFNLVLTVLLNTAVCVIAVASTATTLHKVDLTRQRGEAEILSLNAGLELRVEERTQELAQVSSQLRLVNRSLELLSQQDGLTGLANRRYFDAHLAEQIAIARRYGRTLALVLCDVDFFKAYNDHYGHQPGDECLKEIAGALRSCCRRTADMAARYGGEEFALILPETEIGEALIVAEAAREAVAHLAIAHEKSPAGAHVSISGGVAVLLHDTELGAQQLIMDADQALFEAKRLGRNRMAVAGKTGSGRGRDCAADNGSTTVSVALRAIEDVTL